jgi:acetyl-CoA C-acetyltransferase
MAEAYIAAAVRSAVGRRKGALIGVHPADLGGAVLRALVERAEIDPAAIDDVIVGCVTNGGEQTYAFGRNVVLASNLPDSIPAVTIDRQCGSSQQAVQFAAQAVMSGTQDMVVAMGVEHMTRVPMGSNYMLYANAGIGTGPFAPSIQKRYGVKEFNQLTGAQMIADKYGFTRRQMDEYALGSHQRGAAAIKAGAFKREIVPIATENGLFDTDEGVRFDASLDAMGTLNPVLEGGSVTAGNASQISDGSAALLVVNEKALKQHGLTPLARVHALAVTAGDPVLMLEEPAPATKKALARAGMKLNDIDLFEVNEAFACVALSWLKNTGADPAKLNVNGGAIALGHPLGASGAKLMTTLIHSLRAQGKRWGLQTMCEGGGLANATILEAL